MRGNSRQDGRGDSPKDVEHFKMETVQPTDFNKKLTLVATKGQGRPEEQTPLPRGSQASQGRDRQPNLNQGTQRMKMQRQAIF